MLTFKKTNNTGIKTMASSVKQTPHTCTYQNCPDYLEHAKESQNEPKSGKVAEAFLQFAQAFATAYATAKSLVSREVRIQD
jgi:hypothetical protein